MTRLLFIGCVSLLAGCVSGPPERSPVSAKIDLPPPAAPKAGSYFNSAAALVYLEREGAKLVREGKVNTNLQAQALPNNCRLQLGPTSSDSFLPAKLFQKAEMSVGVLGHFVSQSNNVEFTSLASGFFLTKSGAFVTCAHVLETSAGNGYVVMLRDGRLCPVQKVLATGTANDVAIVQVEGETFTALPVGPAAPVGSAVWVISHPVGWLYTFTGGMVSGYTDWVKADGGWQTTWMTISADYAGGSSGAPVLNEHGEVVGIASKTKTLYSDESPRNPQMALKLCVPSTAILELVQH